MQNIKKYFMTLALLLTAVTSAWAQSTLNVVEFEVPADWENDKSYVTAGDLSGFSASTLAKAQAWTGAPAEGNAMLIYAFHGDIVYYFAFANGEPKGGVDNTMSKALVFGLKSNVKIYYTGELTEWVLKPDETGKKWTFKMPASNIELQVEYYAESNIFLGKEALADKANIAVTAGETTVEFDDEGKSANTVTEGDKVTVTYSGPRKVMGVKAEKKASAEALPALNITNPVVGQVIGSDGKNYAAASVPSGVTKVAMIAYVSGSNGLAIAMADEGEMNWATAKSTCEAKTPAFTNGTWKLPTQDEWRQMFIANGGNEDSYDGLNMAITTAGGTAFQDGTVNYWSSSEYSSDQAYKSQFYYGYPMWLNDWKVNNQWVRACLAF